MRAKNLAPATLSRTDTMVWLRLIVIGRSRPSWRLGRQQVRDLRRQGRALAGHNRAARTLFADDTPIPVLDPDRGRTKTGRLWVYARDDRPWCGRASPAAIHAT
jgi:hypothetical protein